jgi:glycosyltransferase involved in cell wall biosynthesis
VVNSLRKIGIGLNFRGGGSWANPQHPAKLQYDFHVALNSGIKLINCLGFGTPSVSADESAYREIGEDCTIFSEPAQCAQWVRELQINDALYGKLRKNCLLKSKRFHLDTIAMEYKKLLQSL